jgi:hypothetical protein
MTRTAGDEKLMDSVRFSGCRHRFCRDCASEYVAGKVKERQCDAASLTCPWMDYPTCCRAPLSLTDVAGLLPAAGVMRYLDTLAKNAPPVPGELHLECPRYCGAGVWACGLEDDLGVACPKCVSSAAPRPFESTASGGHLLPAVPSCLLCPASGGHLSLARCLPCPVRGAPRLSAVPGAGAASRCLLSASAGCAPAEAARVTHVCTQVRAPLLSAVQRRAARPAAALAHVRRAARVARGADAFCGGREPALDQPARHPVPRLRPRVRAQGGVQVRVLHRELRAALLHPVRRGPHRGTRR